MSALKENSEQMLESLRAAHVAEREAKAEDYADAMNTMSKQHADKMQALSEQHEIQVRELAQKCELERQQLVSLRTKIGSIVEELRSQMRNDLDVVRGKCQYVELTLKDSVSDCEQLQRKCTNIEQQVYETGCLLADSRDTIKQLTTDPVVVALTLDMKFEEVQHREAFATQIVDDVVRATDVESSMLKVNGLRAGSVIVEIQMVWHKSLGERSLQDLVADMETQSKDASSLLRQVLFLSFPRPLSLSFLGVFVVARKTPHFLTICTNLY